MSQKIPITLAAIAISMGLGGLMAIGLCSRRTWCPRYLQRRLDDWRKQMERQNEERRSLKLVPRENPEED